jgi:hypothetical protein
MSTLTIAVIIAPIIAISSCIIGDCLEWKKDLNVKVLSVKVIGYTVITVFITSLFFPSLGKSGFSDGFGYKSLAILWVFGFGYLFPTMGQLIGLAYMKLTKLNV